MSNQEGAGPLRFEVRVRPRAKADRVGGAWGPNRALLVTVRAPAVAGKANEAVVKLLAEALGVTRRQLTLVRGTTSRTKLVQLHEPADDTSNCLARLRGDPAPGAGYAP